MSSSFQFQVKTEFKPKLEESRYLLFENLKRELDLESNGEMETSSIRYPPKRKRPCDQPEDCEICGKSILKRSMPRHVQHMHNKSYVKKNSR